jgi:hypothetical protein
MDIAPYIGKFYRFKQSVKFRHFYFCMDEVMKLLSAKYSRYDDGYELEFSDGECNSKLYLVSRDGLSEFFGKVVAQC